MASRPRSQNARGFSLLELLMVLAILGVIMGVVVADIMAVQQRYKGEENKLDVTQQGRELMDQFQRDLHQTGYPAATMYTPGVLSLPTANDYRNAVGLVSVSATDVWFEGDIDGDGQVESVHYTLQTGPGGNCPCTVQRSAVPKVNGTPPMSQTTSYSTAVEGLINSGGAGGTGTNGSLAIDGTTAVMSSAGSVTQISNSTLYAPYQSAPLFAAFDQNGSPVTLPVNLASDPASLSNIRAIRITLNVLSATADPKTNVRTVVTLTAAVQI